MYFFGVKWWQSDILIKNFDKILEFFKIIIPATIIQIFWLVWTIVLYLFKSNDNNENSPVSNKIQEAYNDNILNQLKNPLSSWENKN